MDITINLELLNNTYVYSYQGHAILKVEEKKVTKEQADKIYDHLIGLFNSGVDLGIFLKELEHNTAMDTFKSGYDLLETAINLGAQSK